MAKVAILGLGTVGSGVAEVLTKNADSIARKAGEPVEIKYILGRHDYPDSPFRDLVVQDFSVIENDPEISVVAECIGGTGAARDDTLRALKAGKSVVTSNKEVVAEYGDEFFAIAQEKNLNYLYEASVGGGIPIIDPLKHSLIANEITSVMGIVNGTTNYMLTRMADNGLSYEDALHEAQQKGFAEADPTADVGGFDAAAKIAILASIAFNSRVTLDDVFTDGITNISPVDIEAARDMGYVIKLLAIAHRREDGVDVRVHPTMIPTNHQLATVNGVFNAIYVVGDFVGETMFFGEGAGAGAAASAVMGDVLEVARHIQQGVAPIVGCTCTDDLPILPMDELVMRYYLRFSVTDRPGVLETMAGVFARHNISVKSIVQRGRSGAERVDQVVVTHRCRERDIREALEEALALDNVVLDTPSVIRVEE